MLNPSVCLIQDHLQGQCTENLGMKKMNSCVYCHNCMTLKMNICIHTYICISVRTIYLWVCVFIYIFIQKKGSEFPVLLHHELKGVKRKGVACWQLELPEILTKTPYIIFWLPWGSQQHRLYRQSFLRAHKHWNAHEFN